MGKVVKALAIVAAMVVIFVATSGIGSTLLASLAIKGIIATAILATATVAASFALSKLTAPKPSALGTGPPSVFRQSISNSFIAYGRRRLGGLLVFFHSAKTAGKHWRYFVIACAGHRCAGNPTFMLNDEAVTVDGSGMVTSGPYASAAWLWFVRGTDTDVANATFVSECGGKWTSAHKGLGIAKIYAKFKLTDAVIEAGMPNITVIVDGKDDITDPRDASEGYTNNAALVFYDWMKLPREEGGFGAYADEIPDDDWISAQANVCDEDVDGEPRYAIDGVITTGAAPSEVRDALVQSCAGSYAFTEGRHKMRVGYWVPPSETLTEDMLAGGIVVSAFDTADNAVNEVQITYIEPANGYQSAAAATQTLDTPPTDIRQTDLDLPFIISKARAERIGSIMLKRAQCEKTVSWPMTIEGLKTGALDIVQLDTTRYNLSNYAWIITTWGLSADFGVSVSLREENEEIYGAPTYVAPDTVPTIDVPDPILTDSETQNIIRTTYPRALTLTGQTIAGDGQIVISNFVLDWPGIGEVAVTGTTLTGLTPTATYFVFCDVDQIGDATPTFGATTEYADALNSSDNPLRIYLNQVVIIPADGDPPTSGEGSGGGYGGGPELPGPL